MWKDPIVEEVRNTGVKLAQEAGNDLHRFCQNLRTKQKEHAERLAHRKPCLRLKPTGTEGR